MAARDIVAAAFIAAGIIAVSVAAFLVSLPVGFATLGILLLALGVAIGFGERDSAAEPALAPALSPVPEGSAGATAVMETPQADAAPADEAGIPALLTQSTVPLANYLGRTGAPVPVQVPAP